MAIITGDFQFRLSGGAANANPAASLGGSKSSEAMSATIDAMFDAVDAQEALDGDVEYRCVYIHNANGADTMTALQAWLSANTPLAGTTLDIGVGTSAVNGVEQTVANETAAPTGVTFSAPSTSAAALAMGNIPAGQHRALWLRRTITAGAGSSANDGVTLDARCQTA